MDITIQQIASLVIQVLVAGLVWRYYRARTFPRFRRYSTFGARFWTGSVDACVLWPIGFVASALLSLELPPAVAAGIIIAQNLLWLFYTVHMHAKYGQTYGKMVCKVRVIDFKTEGAITFRQAFLREGIPIAVSLGLVGCEISAVFDGALSPAAIARGELAEQSAFWLLASLPLLWFVAEAVTMLTNEKRRALHDYLAGTVVVRTNLE